MAVNFKLPRHIDNMVTPAKLVKQQAVLEQHIHQYLTALDQHDQTETAALSFDTAYQAPFFLAIICAKHRVHQDFFLLWQ